MTFRQHIETVGNALGRWFVAQTADALAVGVLWLAGLLILRIPWAPLWALLGALFQFIPNVGTVLALLGPAAAAVFSGHLDRLVSVLLLYALIVAADGLLLQPLLMRRATRVPILASIFTPLLLGLVLGFWGVFLSAPLLAILYAYRQRRPAPNHQR
jgi:predicted PurR-regulated permease PerM